MGFSIDQVRDSLPNIGDQRNGGTVDYVNKDHLWYRVQYSWGTNSYKLPKAAKRLFDHAQTVTEPMLKKYREPKKRYLVVETGKYYPSFEKIGYDVGCDKTSVRNAFIRGHKLKDKWTIIKNEEGSND